MVPIAKADASLLRDFASALTTAMQRTGVKRIVLVSTAFLFKDSILPPDYLLGRLLFPGVVKDASAMERIIVGSNLAWTIVRPPQLTDEAHSGKYRVREGHLPTFGFNISRADVADCFLKTLPDPTSIGKILGVSH
jgi:putative NADH-flavin reductase